MNDEEKQQLAMLEIEEARKHLRDQFAMAALTGLVDSQVSQLYRDITEMAYLFADAMMKARQHDN